MRLNIAFDRKWTFDEIKDYLANPDNEKYEDLDYFTMCELLSCALVYVSEKGSESFTEDEMNLHAKEIIQSDCIDYASDELISHETKERFEEEIKDLMLCKE